VVVDSSALVAIIGREPGHEWLSEQLRIASLRRIGSPTYLESTLVLEGRTSSSAGIVPRTLMELGIQVASFTPEMAERATYAWRRYGKGLHPAKLNLGDCCTYALAEHLGLPILCVGNDFAQTDLPVLRPPES
jgi:ribonuclease VapC